MRRAPVALVLLTAVSRAQEQPPAPVVVAPVEEREVAAGRAFVGAVEPVRTSTVGSELEGLVTGFLVREGDRVEADQPLARLRTRVLELRLAAARAQRTLREQELLEARNGPRREEIDEARARVRQAEAEVELRAWKLESARTLRARESISEDELKDAQLLDRQAEARLEEEKAALRLLEAGTRQERIAAAEAQRDAAQAEVDRLADDLERHTIKAPFAGYVVAERTEVGQWLDRGAAVAEIAALDEVDVTVPVLEDYVAGLALGTKVAVTVGAVPDRLFEGELRAVVPRADPRARTFPVKIRLANPRANGASVLLKAGMFASVNLAVGAERAALLVPKDALVLGGQHGPVVYAVRDGVAQSVPVTLGLAVDGLIAVQGALAKGQQVVVRGNERLRPGQAVQVTEGG